MSANLKQDDLSADLSITLPVRQEFLESSIVAAIKGALVQFNDLGVSGELHVHIELKPSLETPLIQLAKSLGWKLALLNFERTRLSTWVLKSPRGEAFRDGAPIAGDDLSALPARKTEYEAWQDLPQTEELIREHSRR